MTAVDFISECADFCLVDFALLSILQDISEGRDFAENYSFITICALSMWDTVVCLVALVFAFSNQVNQQIN